jgi:hypothetical protein
MPMTPASSLVSYLSVDEFLDRRDRRSVAQYCTDDPSNPADPNNLGSNRQLIAALNGASGQLESAVMRSQIYQLADLQALTGVSLEYMKKILSDLAMYDLMTRRPGPAPSETVIDAYNRALEALEALANGTRIFSFLETAEAGLVETQPFLLTDYYKNNLISARWTPFFGIRQAERRFW